MMSEAAARALREQHRQNLEGWREPDGHLLPTEPDPDERERTRERLRVAISTLNRVLGDEPERRGPRRVSVRG